MQIQPRAARYSNISRLFVSIGLLFCFFAVNAFPQAGTSSNVSFASGSLIIPMDNDKQGNNLNGCGGPSFNIRVYGLAARLLHANIPLHWAIANKNNKDSADITFGSNDNASRYDAPGTSSDTQSCVNTATSFAGGPLVIGQEYRAQALIVINEFNAEITGFSASSNRVRVFSANDAFNAPIRYTLTHKPRIAIGPVNGGWGGDPHTTLFEAAKLEAANNTKYYQPAPDDIINADACFTAATQAHATSAPYYNDFRAFVQSGGNFLIQCESITHYEDLQPIKFHTSAGFNLFGNSSQFPGRSNGTPTTNVQYPNPAMPFTQFVGGFAGDVEGAVSEFSVTGGTGNFINGTLAGVQNNNGGNWNSTYSSVAGKLSSVSGAGGHVFTIGGHDYFRGSAWPNTSLERLNAQRMILNAAVLVPASRPNCGLDNPIIKGFKFVELQPADDVNGDGRIQPGDVVTWTISYINAGLGTATNFQITDLLNNIAGTDLTYVPGSLQLVSVNGAGTAANISGSYNGSGANADMLTSGTLGPNGRIRVRIKTVVNSYNIHYNQPVATGNGVPQGTLSDTVDAGTFGTFGSYAPNEGTGSSTVCQEYGPGCENNFQSPALDPTGIRMFAPTSAPATISGRVISNNGSGIAKVVVSLRNAATGASKTVVTNPFGYYSFSEVGTAAFYNVSVANKLYVFNPDNFSFNLTDDVVGLTFVGSIPATTTARKK